jgi:UDP-N-acetylglucosamine diphosphorylase / glucose-1-phosphate thymidylyltransferase / UDP-N-acetylgalactosamine diphosphorylase / glucosamine-1-phosphate N-acetyltransferase / galactosamine-1-phosphate N-acetyltransferase
MNIFFENILPKENLYPFTATRNVEDIRIGILTIKEKWDMISKKISAREITVNANIIPSLTYAENFINNIDAATDEIRMIEYPWDIFKHNDWALRKDFELLTVNRLSQAISPTNNIISPENIFIEEGATVEYCTINASTGPVYIGRNSTVMEGSLIRGPFALCENAVVKMGTKIYGATTIGPNCIVGGEIKNAVLFSNSNKAHDGYLGDSVIGEWCNLGAGTSNSNLKNTAGDVMVWDNSLQSFTNVGIKCGVIMGDYSRCAINTSFNTGTVVGVCCNIFGTKYPLKFVPDFTWGEDRYIFDKCLQHINNWKKLKGAMISENEKINLLNIYNQKLK